MLVYLQKKVFIGLLDRKPKYIFPPAPPHPPGEVDGLRPAVEGVEIRHHGSETAVVVEGDNLWFCYQLSVGGRTKEIPADHISGSSIQFNVQKDKEKIAALEDGKAKVILHNYFTKPVKQEVPVNEKVSDMLNMGL